MRKSSVFAGFVFLLAGLTLWTTLYGGAQEQARSQARATRARLVRQLGLTDLALFTEAGYLRHLSQADRYMAFQDHPVAFEHFPGGGLIQPPEHLRP